MQVDQRSRWTSHIKSGQTLGTALQHLLWVSCGHLGTLISVALWFEVNSGVLGGFIAVLQETGIQSALAHLQLA